MKKLNILYDFDVEHGEVTYGAEAPVHIGKSHGLNFYISDVVATDGKSLALGIRKKEVKGTEPVPEVVQAFTHDGINFEDEKALFSPPADKHYFVWAQEVAMARNDERLLLMGCAIWTAADVQYPTNIFHIVRITLFIGLIGGLIVYKAILCFIPDQTKSILSTIDESV